MAALVLAVLVPAAACAQMRGAAPGGAALPPPDEWPATLRFVPCHDGGDGAGGDCATAYAIGGATYEVPWCVPVRSSDPRWTVVATGTELGDEIRATVIDGQDPELVLALEARRDCGHGRDAAPVLMFGRRARTAGGDLLRRLACELGTPEHEEVAHLCQRTDSTAAASAA